mmetsp:Transcript_41229/g.89882  ORF Transcript_41229/g.89882 Transcript_41229/m.89882 type:complete len:250 (+) Transcript_41229:1699-2448(+)
MQQVPDLSQLFLERLGAVQGAVGTSLRVLAPSRSFPEPKFCHFRRAIVQHRDVAKVASQIPPELETGLPRLRRAELPLLRHLSILMLLALQYVDQMGPNRAWGEHSATHIQVGRRVGLSDAGKQAGGAHGTLHVESGGFGTEGPGPLNLADHLGGDTLLQPPFRAGTLLVVHVSLPLHFLRRVTSMAPSGKINTEKFAASPGQPTSSSVTFDVALGKLYCIPEVLWVGMKTELGPRVLGQLLQMPHIII